MQSGAFLQLVLTLAAIASRMHLLVTEIHEILVSGWTACHRILQVLNVGNLQTERDVSCEVALIAQGR